MTVFKSGVLASQFTGMHADHTLSKEAFSEFLNTANFHSTEFWAEAKKLWLRLPREERFDAAMEINNKTPWGPDARSLVMAHAALRFVSDNRKGEALEAIRHRAPFGSTLRHILATRPAPELIALH